MEELINLLHADWQIEFGHECRPKYKNPHYFWKAKNGIHDLEPDYRFCDPEWCIKDCIEKIKKIDEDMY